MYFRFLLNHETGGGSGGLTSIALCLGLTIPLTVIAMGYWYRYYYVRAGLWSGLLGAGMALILNGFAVMAMILSVMGRTVFNRREVFGPCPNCGRRKMISNKRYPTPHEIQPHCPHCGQMVLQYRFLTQDEWHELGFR